MIKITVNSKGEIIKAEPVGTKEIILDWDMEDGVYFQDGKYVKMADVILPETEITKTIQMASFRRNRYMVNITTKGKKKLATIHDAKSADENISIEYDEERGDKVFVEYKEAQEYANTFNL